MYADEQKITTLKKDGIEHFRGSMKNRLKLHAQNVTRDKGSAAHIKDVAREFAYKTYPKHWKVLKDNKALRQQQIQKYYGILHRGKKIPDALLQKIEKDFARKFELAEKADPSTIYESREEHSENVNKFLTDHGNEINAERRANAVLFLFSNMSETEKVKKYKAFLELYNYKPEKEKEKEKKEEKANRLKDANKELLKYFNEFDLKKLEFNEISDLSDKFAEIDQFLQVMTEVQGLPASMYLLGILNEEEFLTMQARMEVIIGYSYLFENAVSAGSTVLDALVDSEDMLAVENVLVNKKEIPEELKDELILDKENYESMTSDESNFELSQYLIARNGMEEAVNKSSFYKPGGKMEDALIAAGGYRRGAFLNSFRRWCTECGNFMLGR
ncbi:MAG: hypothetical protein IJU93_08845 [Lachnospiraceae bacterium]|nr:hypothetical protein [Lachnospiraceae bacterium]